MKQFFNVFCVAVVFVACMFIGCSDGGGSGGSSDGGGNPGGGGSSSSIVGTWETTAEHEYGFSHIEIIFNSNRNGVWWGYDYIAYDKYDNESFSVGTFTWSNIDGMVFLLYGGEGQEFFSYNNGNTFRLWGKTFTRTSSTSSVCNNFNAPTNVRIVENSSGFTITWNAVSEARAYHIYSSNVLSYNGEVVWTTDTPSFSIDWKDVDWGSGNSKEYYFRITAISNCGESGHSSFVQATRP